MYDTRDVPQIWEDAVKRDMVGLGFHASGLHPVAYHHRERQVVVVVHVDDFLCVGLSRYLL